MRRVDSRISLITGLATISVAALLWAAMPRRPSTVNLSADLPAGALMTVESNDFGAMLEHWIHSPAQRAWLSSASYSAFTNSRLFGRLSDAQAEFEVAGKTPLDITFLQQIAGKESIFAWYNIGNLEFLYLTHLSPDRIAKLNILQQRGSFARREAGGTSFYVRISSGADDKATGQSAPPGHDAGVDAAGTAPDTSRTVAFAVRGDWLLLATREDLIANALELMEAQDTGTGTPESQANVGWYAAAGSAGPSQHGELHMLLDLQALTRTPQFRTYWIQRNVTETRQYRAAVVDLYPEQNQFREERVLLPMQSRAETTEQDVTPLEALVPAHAGVYRATANPSVDVALAALQQKVLTRAPDSSMQDLAAPAADINASPVGSATDLETRIDAPPLTADSLDVSFEPLHQILAQSQLSALMTIDRTEPSGPVQDFVHISSAVILHAARPWKAEKLSDAILAALRPRLTASSLGIHWAPIPVASGTLMTTGAIEPLSLYINGPLAVLCTSPELMSDILAARHAPFPDNAPQAQIIAGFRHDQERAPFRRLTSQLGHNDAHANSTGADSPGSGGSGSVDLFRDTLPSLSDTFATLASEHLIERRDHALVRQTVTYRWDTGQQ